MKILIIHFLFKALILSAKAQSSHLVDFVVELDGTFELTVLLLAQKGLPPQEILKRFIDPKTVVESSNVVKEISYQPSSKILKLESSEKTESVSTRSCKSFSCAITQSRCRFSKIEENEALYECRLDLEHEKTAELFYSGLTQFSCKKSVKNTVCQFLVKGRPKPFSVFFISRTPQQLAIGGAQETAMGLLKIASSIALNKDKVHRSLQGVSEDFYPKLTKSIKTDPRKRYSVSY